jgi:hypothetical protein
MALGILKSYEEMPAEAREAGCAPHFMPKRS